MATVIPRPGDGQLQWNAGAWFGGQFGCTAWLLPGAVLLAGQAPRLAMAWLGCWLVPNALGLALWLRRDRIRPYPAFLLLLTVAGLGSGIALLSVRLGAPAIGLSLGLRPSDLWTLLTLLAGLVLWFSLMEHVARRRRTSLPPPRRAPGPPGSPPE